VHVVQGDTDLRCDLLIVYYEGDNIAAGPATGGRPAPVAATSAGKAAPVSGKPGGKQQIKRLEAKGSVMVTQNDQVATGDTGIFDTKANTITLSGKVTLTKGSNVIRGQRMVVNMVTGVAQVEGQSGGVRMLINPGEGGLAMDPPKPADPPKSAPARPARVNPR
jgi:lipopolysaccharide export system protein LptA